MSYAICRIEKIEKLNKANDINRKLVNSIELKVNFKTIKW